MCRMKKYLHQLPFATEADAILTDNADETRRGYSLYAELESPKLNSILAELQYIYRFAIKANPWERQHTWSWICFAEYPTTNPR